MKNATSFLTTLLACAAMLCAAPALAQSGTQVDASGNKVDSGPPSRKDVPVTGPVSITDGDRARGMKDTPDILAKMNLPCEVTEARYVGDAAITKDGKDVKGSAYEVVCKSGQGFFLSSFRDGSTAAPINCNQAEALNKLDKASPTCALAGNKVNYYWLTPLVKTRMPSCNVSKARWIGPNVNKDKALYEIQCKGGLGAIVAIANYNVADQTVGLFSCVKMEGTPLGCQFTPHAAAVKYLEPMAQKKKADCAVSEARYIGGKNGEDYYEVGCETPPGFIIVLNDKDELQSAISCDKAAAIGGCKFTDATAVKAANKGKDDAVRKVYIDALAKAAVPCTFDQFLRIGGQTDTGRDLAEFKCPEQPNGLLALVPVTKPDAVFEARDCFAARLTDNPCKLTSEVDLLVSLKAAAKASKQINPDCDLAQVRYGFAPPSGVIVMELACANTRGYIAVLNKARTAFNPAVPCHVAATSDKVPEKCTIAGNGAKQD